MKIVAETAPASLSKLENLATDDTDKK